MTLLIGPCFNQKNTSNTGGIVVLFENYLSYCDRNNHKYILVNTNKSSYKNKFIALIKIYLKIIIGVFKSDRIFLHGTINDYIILSPIASLLGRLLNKKVYYRKFAGDFDARYEKLDRLSQRMLRWSLRNSSGLFWETKSLVRYGGRFNPKSYWFPNVRVPHQLTHSAPYSKKLVFISQIRREKGIDYLLQLADLLPEGYTIDVYGPIVDSKYSESLLCKRNVKYGGVLVNSDVQDVLMNYDLLLLPTFWQAEGYPGIIIEAFSVGVPVVSTKIGGIPEIIENGVNGILVNPHSINELYEAIIAVDDHSYELLSIGAKRSFVAFNSDEVNHRVNDIISC